jgi:hypothetical protein
MDGTMPRPKSKGEEPRPERHDRDQARAGRRIDKKKSPAEGGPRPGPTSEMERSDLLFERLRCYRLLVMPKTTAKSNRRHGDDDRKSEKGAHR